MPFVGWHTVASGGVVVVRQWQRQARKALDRAVALMRDGANFYMSIEGRRSVDGKLGAYKHGPAILAIQSCATIVPVWMTGGRQVMPFGGWQVTPGSFHVDLLPSISTRGMTLDDRHSLTAKLRALAEACSEKAPDGSG